MNDEVLKKVKDIIIDIESNSIVEEWLIMRRD